MASSFYSNSQHVDFDSVLAMDDQCMVSMFQGLMASGLAGFLGCPAVIYEADLVDFFENALVQEGVIISTVAGQLVEISEEWFAESFELPVDGLGDLSEIPKDVIFYARSIVSLSGEPVSLSGKKNQMKIEFRLLCDIMAKELTKEARAHGLTWKKTCCSKIFEGIPRDRGAVIARSNTNTRSSCWIRTMKKRQYDDSLPPVNNFFKTLTKRWADICLEVVAFCSSRRLLPVGSVNFCRGLPVGEPVFRVAPRHFPVFAFRVSQFCSVFIDFSLFSWLPTADITDFLSSIALNRTAFRSAQISQNIVSVVPSVQFSLDQRQSSPTSADSSSSLHFDSTDLDATVSSLPPVSIDLSAALADFQAIISEQINESQSGISSNLHKIEQGLRDSLREQAEVFKILFQGARQEGRTIDDVQTLRFNEFRKNILTQNASIFTGLADVRKEVQEVNAKVDIIASRLNDVQQNVEATKEALSHQLLEFQSQAQANQNILHAQLSELVNYINRGSADKKGESSSRGPQQPPNVQIRDSGTGGGSAVRTPDFAQRVEMA
ncbi:hypothetical protein F511_18996 [Dorcoceras hygrometricum]|uniref:Dystroglycan-like n=1 Tax=Dorcoceras hygrometricum TaxID=472368 RepID=A0A2Z7D7S0_9LAMI|nr:hypothetical protein F511_18996 [Dorcoceras hygrometricum]